MLSKMTNRLLPINDFIDRLVNANGNQMHIRAAVVEFDSNINEAIAKPFATARENNHNERKTRSVYLQGARITRKSLVFRTH